MNKARLRFVCYRINILETLIVSHEIFKNEARETFIEYYGKNFRDIGGIRSIVVLYN